MEDVGLGVVAAGGAETVGMLVTVVSAEVGAISITSRELALVLSGTTSIASTGITSTVSISGSSFEGRLNSRVTMTPTAIPNRKAAMRLPYFMEVFFESVSYSLYWVLLRE